MGNINSRAKGARGERELAQILREHGYTKARRGQQFSGINGDADVVDALPEIHIECKRVESLNLYKAVEQAERDSRDGEMPAVFHRKNNKQWLVSMKLDDFMKIYKEFERGIKNDFGRNSEND